MQGAVEPNSQLPQQDDGASELYESEVVLHLPLVTHHQAPEVVPEPSKQPLDRPAPPVASKPASVLGLSPLPVPPVRSTHKMPLSTFLGSRQGRPLPSARRGGSGSSGSKTSHCSSVRSKKRHLRQGTPSGATIIVYEIASRDPGIFKEGETVLVRAAAGGVGTLPVRMAKPLGAGKVIATASSDEKLDLARSLAADVLIDYVEKDWPEKVREATGGKDTRKASR